jgi:hypothetical protein
MGAFAKWFERGRKLGERHGLGDHGARYHIAALERYDRMFEFAATMAASALNTDFLADCKARNEIIGLDAPSEHDRQAARSMRFAPE